jgi:hypothetical protein
LILRLADTTVLGLYILYYGSDDIDIVAVGQPQILLSAMAHVSDTQNSAISLTLEPFCQQNGLFGVQKNPTLFSIADATG